MEKANREEQRLWQEQTQKLNEVLLQARKTSEKSLRQLQTLTAETTKQAAEMSQHAARIAASITLRMEIPPRSVCPTGGAMLIHVDGQRTTICNGAETQVSHVLVSVSKNAMLLQALIPVLESFLKSTFKAQRWDNQTCPLP
jgi:hypothetical protein